MNSIKFSQNWNNKLDCSYFTTIRIYTKEKWDYYYDLFDSKEEVAVLLKEKIKCVGKIVDIEIRLLKDISDFSVMVDAGVDRLTFEQLMESMYRKYPEWNGGFTRMIILCIQKTKKPK